MDVGGFGLLEESWDFLGEVLGGRALMLVRLTKLKCNLLILTIFFSVINRLTIIDRTIDSIIIAASIFLHSQL